MKFAIIIPFRPKAESTDWENECFLLMKSVQSILRQTYGDFHVFIVYTDYPLIELTDERVSYIEFIHGYKQFNEIQKRDELRKAFGSEKLVVRRWDKGRKLTFGSMIAKNAGYDYIMAMDADDRLSKYFLERLVKEAETLPVPGWYMESGYLKRQNGWYIISVNKGFKNFNGSSHVLRSDLVRIPDFQSPDWIDFNLFTDHGWIQQRMKDEYGVDLLPIKNPSLVYLAHHSNISKVKNEYGNAFRKIIKRLFRGSLITKQLKDEFFLN